MTTPTMQPVKSSNIVSVGYDEPNKNLHIQFKSGGHYSYSDVPPEAHQALVNADSIGGHFSKQFAGKFPHTKIA
jgi:hypothetical protein